MENNRWKIIVSVSLFILAIFTGSESFASVKMVRVNGQERPAYRAGEVIVKYKDGVARSHNEVISLYQRLSVKNIKRFNGTLKNFEQLIFDSSNLSVEQAV